MAGEAGLYEALWHPEKLDAKTGSDIAKRLTEGLALLESDPERFKAHNPPNGWGDYDTLVEVVREYLRAVHTYPGALIDVCG
jgi:hypothetical protein